MSEANDTNAAALAPAASSSPESAPAAATAPAAGVDLPQTPTAPAEPLAPAEAPVAEEPKLHTDTPTLLEEAKVDLEAPTLKEGEKPAEAAKPAEGEKPAEAAPVYDFKPYELPQDFKADDARLKEFNTMLVEPTLDPQSRGQKLIDLHIQEMVKFRDMMVRDQHKTFDTMRAGWRDDIKSDPELGGAGFQTTMQSVAIARDMFVPKEHLSAFNQFLRTTGAGDNKEFIRFLTNVTKRFKEPSPLPQSGFKPPGDIGQKPGSMGGRRSTLYDHPNSDAKRGR